MTRGALDRSTAVVVLVAAGSMFGGCATSTTSHPHAAAGGGTADVNLGDAQLARVLAVEGRKNVR